MIAEYWFWRALLLVVSLWLSIAFHELGHLVVLRERFRDVKLRYVGGDLLAGDDWMYRALSGDERSRVYLTGILWGLAPVVWVFWFDAITGVVLGLLYVLGCRHDIMLLTGDR